MLIAMGTLAENIPRRESFFQQLLVKLMTPESDCYIPQNTITLFMDCSLQARTNFSDTIMRNKPFYQRERANGGGCCCCWGK
jgi:hypothetical protein